MSATQVCPPDESVWLYATDAHLLDAESRGHIESCERCQARSRHLQGVDALLPAVVPAEAASRVLGGLALFGGVLLLLLNPLLTGQDAGPTPVVNALLPAYAVPAALAGATRRRGRVLSAYALAAAFTWINLAVRHAFHPDALALWAAPVEDAELWAYSGAWLLLGAALLGWGVRAGRRPARLAALALAGLASAKLFAVDMADLDGLWRVLSFGGLGLSLIGLSAFYRRVTATPRGTPGATTPRP